MPRLATSKLARVLFGLLAYVSLGIGLIAIAMLSGLLSLGILKKSQPADLLR